MDFRRTKLTVNKAGSGSNTFRVTLKTSWLRKMGLGEDARNIKLEFDGKTITIKNDVEESKMLNELLEKAKLEIENEMNRTGFIDDSDLTDRFLDELARSLVENEILQSSDDIEVYYEHEARIEELAEELLEKTKDHMGKAYKSKSSVNERSDFTGCYYKDRAGLKKWNELGE